MNLTCGCSCGAVIKPGNRFVHGHNRRGAVTAPLVGRLGGYIDVTPTCWLWKGGLNGQGYARISDAGKLYRVHRIMYELAKGPISNGLELDHLCRVRHCVNPDHLEAVTARENQLRGVGPQARHAKQTHCVHGHEFTRENTYWGGWKGRQRECRICHRDRVREYRRRKAS